MADVFKYDVFLSHSSKDNTVVFSLAERLRTDGIRVWLDDWEILPGDNIPAKIEEGLDHSRVLVLCMSANAFGSDWAQLESHTFRFKDPLNKERRFIPLRLDETTIKDSLAQFHYVSWLPDKREREYAKLLDACRPPAKRKSVRKKSEPTQLVENLKKPDRTLGQILQFPMRINDTSLRKQRTKSAKKDGNTRVQGKARASATRGGVSVAFVGSNHGNISIRMPALDSTRTKYPANSIGADANLTNYVEYLCDLYVKFMTPIEPDEAKSWAKVGKHIKTKFRLRKRTRDHLSAERFPDLVDYLVNEKLANTPVGKKHLREGKRLCRTFEEFRHSEM